MDEAVCPQCGLHNSTSAVQCARCRTPLEVATQVTRSPFAEATRVEQNPLSGRPTAPLPPAPSAAPKPAAQELERTRILDPQLTVPADARREPMFAAPARSPAAAARPTEPANPPPVRSTFLDQRLEVTPRPERPTAARLKSLMAETSVASHTPLPRGVEPAAQKTAVAGGPAAASPFVPRHTVVSTRPLQHVAALAIDAGVGVVLLFAVFTLLLATTGHPYPSDRPTAFENFALFWAHSGHIPSRGLALAVALGLGYAGWGARSGTTLGRAVMGLVLVTPEGRIPDLMATAWHVLGCALNLMTLGAGTAWMVVDRSHRSWASLLSRTQVVPKHQVASR